MTNTHIKFDFDKILDNQIAKKCYLDFLKEIKCEEYLLFLDHVSFFESLKSPLNRYKQSLYIKHTFLLDNSYYQLNLDSSTKIEILSKLNSISQHCPKDLFFSLSNIITMTLKEETFNRFIQSKTFTSTLKTHIKNDHTFLSKISINSHINKISSSYHDITYLLYKNISHIQDICKTSSNSAIYIKNY